MIKTPTIVFGTQYYRPPFPDKKYWRSDLNRIANTGMNTVKLWAVWSWMERTRNNFYFDDLDELIDLCAIVGLNVVLNLIPEGAPAWLERFYPDARYTSNDRYVAEFSGAANMPSAGWPGLCRDNELVAGLADRFLATVAHRYARVSNVSAFDVWNEPHIDPAFDYPKQLFCYCLYSVEKFLRWLQLKYDSLEDLNRSWHRAYSCWEDVKAPTRFGTYPDMIEWRFFWLENHAAWLQSRVDAVKSAAPDKPAMTHVPFSGYFGGSGKGGLGQTLTDEFLLARKAERFGLTSFPKWLMNNDFVQHLMNVELIAAAAGETEFWQSELQAGGGLWGAYGSAVANAEEIRLWNWGALAGGAKGIMYWQWRPEPSGLEAPGFGLTTVDGGESERTRVAKEIAQRVLADDKLAGARRILPVNAIYVSRSADLFTFAANRGEKLYADALFGVYQSFFEQGIPVCFMHADAIAQKIVERPRMLYVPASLSLSNREIENLVTWLSDGTTLVVEACTGLFDEGGLLRESPRLLEQVAGLDRPEIDSQDSIDLFWVESSQSKFTGRFYRQDFSAWADDVKILASFSDGRPAIFQREVGTGLIIWICSLCSVAARSDARAAGLPTTRWALQHGYRELQKLRIPDKVFCRLYEFRDHSLGLVAVNYSNEAVKLGAQLSSEEGNFKNGFDLGPRDGGIWQLGMIAGSNHEA